MASERMSSERALLRLQQLAREEREAAARGDVDALCRIADLLPTAMRALEAAPPEGGPALREAVEEIQTGHAAAEACLVAGMAAVTDRLRACAASRRASQSYARRATLSRLGDLTL